MKKSVTRLVVVAVLTAAILGGFSTAEAQTGYGGDDPVVVQTPLRGSSFEPDPATANTGAFGFSSFNPQPSSDPSAGGTGGTGGGLAITGSETDLPLAIGIALVALGGTAVVASRKRDDE